jgi:DNA-binding NtrC family response regulator
VTRANFLIAEPESPESISARKLVIETAKFNVLTAHSGKEAIELLRTFPRLSAFIVHSRVADLSCEALVHQAKQLNPNMPVILLATHDGLRCKGADHQVPSQSPEHLLQLLRDLFGDPRPSQQQPQPISTPGKVFRPRGSPPKKKARS